LIVTGKEKEKEDRQTKEYQSYSDPYLIFQYAMNSPVTRDRYTTRLDKFLSFIGAEGDTVEERCRFLVKKAKSDSSDDWAFGSIIGFLQIQKERVNRKEITGSTVRNYVKAIKLFTEMNDIVILWKKITRGPPKGKKCADDRAPTIEEIRKIIEYPDRRIKPIVCTMVSSGIRLGAWDYLRWGHIQPISRDGDVLAAKILVYAGEEEQYFTFISPEAYQALADWMDFRKKSGEAINSDSWVMRNLWDNRVTKGKGWVTIPRKLKPSGVKALVENAIWTQGLRTKLPPGKRRHEFQADHGFRKYFKTHAEQVMKPINVEILMSHSTGVSDSYYRPVKKDLLDDYLKAVDLLTINNDKATLQKQVAELKQKNTEENYIIKGKLSEKEKEIEMLRQGDSMNTDAITNLSDQLAKVMQEIEILKKQR
jgi:integrase